MTNSRSNVSERKLWRRLVKKLRRKRVRQKLAAYHESTQNVCMSTPSYLTNLAKELALKEEQSLIEEAEKELEHLEWLKRERDAQNRFHDLQEEKRKEETAREEVNLRIQKEWEAAKKRKEEKQRLEERKSELAKAKIDNYITGGGDIPDELLISQQSNPGKDLCPFFSKVAACRFGPACSRNHIVPGISKVIVIPSFYTHFTLNQNRSAEYDTDVGLEFEERETYRDFCEFYDDALSELRTFGELDVVLVCRNGVSHLRGNLYAKYKSERWALAAARSLHARWYGGKQLTVRFAGIEDWSAAVCGDFRWKRCPKGSECNFLHVFRNPGGELMPSTRVESQRSTRSWRWSESPERQVRRPEGRICRCRSSSKCKHKDRKCNRSEHRSSRLERRDNRSRSPDHRSSWSERRDNHFHSPDHRSSWSEQRDDRSRSPVLSSSRLERRDDESRSPVHRSRSRRRRKESPLTSRNRS